MNLSVSMISFPVCLLLVYMKTNDKLIFVAYYVAESVAHSKSFLVKYLEPLIYNIKLSANRDN